MFKWNNILIGLLFTLAVLTLLTVFYVIGIKIPLFYLLNKSNLIYYSIAGGMFAFSIVVAILTGILAIKVGSGKQFKHSAPVKIFITLFLILLISVPVALFFTGNRNFGKGEPDLNKLSKLYHNKEEWNKRAEIIRAGILSGAELNPLPRKTAMNPVIHSERIYAGYSVSNVYFESVPGFYATGNLYRPYPYNNGKPKSMVLIPHGHFKGGRFNPDNQNLAASLAKMGALVMTYDMVGYGDSQLGYHKIGHALTFQLWNSIRVVDFLLTLEDADSSFIAVTGASGGGTQTFLLSAVDKRVTVSAPVVMVSAYIYGGCVCESGLPIHRGIRYRTNNAEIAALSAPDPQLLVSDGKDWTYATPFYELPFIQRIYGFYSHNENIENVHLEREGHDYGPTKRQAVYSFFVRHLHLNDTSRKTAEGLIDEGSNPIEAIETMRAFNPAHPLPSNALKTEKEILAKIKSLQ
jgi:uncharacterized protein